MRRTFTEIERKVASGLGFGLVGGLFGYVLLGGWGLVGLAAFGGIIGFMEDGS